MAKKKAHTFGGEATVSEFRSTVADEWLDSQNIPRGTKIFQRTPTGESFHIGGISVDAINGRVYIEAGREAKPQDAIVEDDADIIEKTGGE